MEEGVRMIVEDLKGGVRWMVKGVCVVGFRIQGPLEVSL